jgi:hypothetical protein
MGEITVLALAGLGVYTLLRPRGSKKSATTKEVSQ